MGDDSYHDTVLRLIKLLNMLHSDNAGERAAAGKKAADMVNASKTTFETIVKAAADKGEMARFYRNAQEVVRRQDAEIEQLRRELGRYKNRGFFERVFG